MNIKFNSNQTQPTCDTKAIDDDQAPEEYNFYEINPYCKFPTELRKCSSSYAEAHLSAYRNRYCYRKIGEDFQPSLDYLFKCDTQLNKACKSGFLLNSLQYA